MSRPTRVSGASAVSSSCADLAERSACIRVEPPRPPVSGVPPSLVHKSLDHLTVYANDEPGAPVSLARSAGQAGQPPMTSNGLRY